MNLKLHSITITDFKGISGEHIVDLESDVTFLSGPNGYGKTTIYDAAELCLTGKVLRIDEAKSRENASKRHQRSILHNDPTKDIKIILDVTCESERRTIQVKCARVVDRQPFIDWTSFQRSVYSPEGEPIDDDPLWPNISSENYKLFTYLQQSDSTFFLRLAQKARHDILTPLIDAGGYEDEKNKIEQFKKQVNSYKTYLKNKLESLDATTVQPSGELIKYERMIRAEDMQDYDSANPFKDLTSDQAKVKRSDIIRKLDELETFLSTFNPDDYVKSEQYKMFIKFSKDKDFLNFLILRNVMGRDDVVGTSKDRVKVRSFTKDVTILKKYVLRKELAVERYNELKDNSERFHFQDRAIFIEGSKQRSIDEILSFIAQSTNQFLPEEKQEATKYLDEYKPIAESVGVYGRLLSELQRLRNELVANTRSLHDHGHGFLDEKCPYCGTKWTSHQELIESISKQTEEIETLKGESVKKLANLEKEIRDVFIAKLVDNLSKLKESALIFDQLKSTGALSRLDAERNGLIDKVLPRVGKALQPIKKWETNIQIVETIRALQQLIEESTSQSEVAVMELIDELYIKNYETELVVLSRLKFELKDDYSVSPERVPSLEEVIEKQEHLSELLSETAAVIEYNPGAVLEEHVTIYKTVFDRNKEHTEFAKSKIKTKRLYIEQEYSKSFMENRKLVESRFAQITMLSSKTTELLETYNDALKDYQKKITKDLQLPFYLYSSKILQNSPQCSGIFMQSQRESRTVVFTTARGETLDAAHQLSSGQLVVVSMAFYLAMNTVYPQKSTKLMLIDDPIQDLDVLNMHSLTELLRREFIGNYQLIMSTHNEFDINYMRYKFGTAVSKDRIKNIDVQELFFDTDVTADEDEGL